MSSSSEVSASSELSANLRLLLGPGSEASWPAASAGPAGPPDLAPVSSRYSARPDDVPVNLGELYEYSLCLD